MRPPRALAVGVVAALACTPESSAPPPAAAAAGELTYVQLGLGGAGIGEAALLIGPDGSVVLVDTGNDSHDDDVLAALDDYVGARVVDHIVITHFHADHGAALGALLEAIEVRGSVITRGFVDVDGANDSVVDNARTALEARPGLHAPLCDDSGCVLDGTRDLALGAARVRFVAAKAQTATASFVDDVGPLSDDDEDRENARSVAMFVEHGAFRMWLAGDLTGGGSDTDDVEGFLLAALVDVDVDVDVDVLHAGHHGRDTSSSRAFVEALAPRAAIMGVSEAHLGSPHASVVETFAALDVPVFATHVALGGAAADVVDASGDVVLQTRDGGARFEITAGGAGEDRVSFRATGP